MVLNLRDDGWNRIDIVNLGLLRDRAEHLGVHPGFRWTPSQTGQRAAERGRTLASGRCGLRALVDARCRTSMERLRNPDDRHSRQAFRNLSDADVGAETINY